MRHTDRWPIYSIDLCVYIFLSPLSLSSLTVITSSSASPPLLPRAFTGFQKTTNPIFNKMVWFDGVPVGSSIRDAVHEKLDGVDGGEAPFIHGKARLKPWDTFGIHHSSGVWVDLVPETKVAHDRGPVLKVAVAISDQVSGVSGASRGVWGIGTQASLTCQGKIARTSQR